MNAWMDGRRIDAWKRDGWVEKGWMDGGMMDERRRDGWVDKCIDEWMNG